MCLKSCFFLEKFYLSYFHERFNRNAYIVSLTFRIKEYLKHLMICHTFYFLFYWLGSKIHTLYILDRLIPVCIKCYWKVEYQQFPERQISKIYKPCAICLSLSLARACLLTFRFCFFHRAFLCLWLQ